MRAAIVSGMLMASAGFILGVGCTGSASKHASLRKDIPQEVAFESKDAFPTNNTLVGHDTRRNTERELSLADYRGKVVLLTFWHLA